MDFSMTQNYLYYFPSKPIYRFGGFFYSSYSNIYSIIARQSISAVKGELYFDDIEPISNAWDHIVKNSIFETVADKCPFTTGFGVVMDNHSIPYHSLFCALLFKLNPHTRFYIQRLSVNQASMKEVTDEASRIVAKITEEIPNSEQIFLQTDACIIVKYLARNTQYFSLNHIPKDLRALCRELRFKKPFLNLSIGKQLGD